VRRGYGTATSILIASVPLCLLELHSNKNELSVAANNNIGRARTERPSHVELLDILNTRVRRKASLQREVLVVPMTPKERDDELRELVTSSWLLERVPPFVRGSDQRREVVQLACQKIASLDPARIVDRRNFRSYSQRVLYNCAVDFVKHPKDVELTDEALENQQHLQHTHSDPETQSIHQQYRELVYKNLKQLRPLRRDILLLAMREGLTFEEIAVRLRLRVRTVYKEFQLALEDIDQAIQDEGPRKEG